MADDPTPGELRIMFENLLDVLGEIRSQMATKEFVNVKLDGFVDRMNRLERDQKDWTRTSTEAHVSLDRDSKARHAETKAELSALEVKLNTRIDGIVSDQRAGEKEIRSVRNSRVTQWIGIGLAWLGTVVLWFIDRGQP